MNETEIDAVYLDGKFVMTVNSIDEENFDLVIKFVLENYEETIEANLLASVERVIKSLITQDHDSLNLYRQFKYLVNKAVYNRLSKKFKNDILAIGIQEDKIDKIIELVRVYIDNISKGGVERNTIKDFEIKTQMPVYKSEYNLKKNNISPNEDVNKQNVLIKFNLEKEILFLEMDKIDMTNFYEQVEKIQEKLDKLY